jgi:hypothetical protein
MKKNALSILMLLLVANLIAQNNASREAVQLELTPVNNHFETEIMAIPLTHDGPFLSYFVKSSQQVEGLNIRFSSNGNNWSEWLPLHPDAHMDFDDDSWISELGFEESGAQWFQLSSTVPYTTLKCHFFNPGHTEEVHSSQPQDIEVTDRSCPCPVPEIQTRAQWCPDGTCFPHPSPSWTNVTHLIIHHSAGTNSSSDWAGVVRAIWDFHVNGNGWSDIGYNWLIDPNGVVYEGRGDNILGAHFCGTNGGTAGTCVMGNFTDIQPTTDAINSLVELYTWKACDKNLDVLASAYHNSSGLTIPRVSGHRDGCATACPGNSFYPMLPDIRQQMFDHIVAGCSGLPGPTGLSGTITGDTEATLSWNDNTDGELGFLLERRVGGLSNFELYATVDPDTTQFIDNDIEEGSVYRYRLRAFSETDTSAYSNVALVPDNVSVIDPFFNDQTVNIYPNPASAHLNIKLTNKVSGKIEVALLDVLSKTSQLNMVFDKSSENQTFFIPLEHIPPGIYLLKIQQNDHNGLFRVVVN